MKKGNVDKQLSNAISDDGKNLNSWEAFEEVIKQNKIETDELEENERAIWSTSQIVYRGQADAEWDLKSVLERNVKDDITVGSYLSLMLKVWNSSPNLYQAKWPDLEKQIKNLNVSSIYSFPTSEANSNQIISFMSHLRHYGFPSPLLDWTENPLIAAFFAFGNIPEYSERVALYTFREHTGYSSNLCKASEPTAIKIGNNIPGIERHQKQKSHYTLCVQQNNTKDFKNARFASIEKDINRNGFYLDANGNDIDLDAVRNALCKYTIPVSERNKVLKKLQAMKITRCSLFEETEDNQLFDCWTKILMDRETEH